MDSVAFTSFHRWFLCGLLATLLGMSPALLSSVQASGGITAYVESDGRVVFVNEVPSEPSTGLAAIGVASSRRQPIHSLIEQTAKQHQLDPELVRAIVQVESNFNPYAVSSRGARGLMQLLPATARRFGVSNLFDPQDNLVGGIRYLKYLMERFEGDLRLSLAAYNAGENVVERRRTVPPYQETQDYLRRISRLYPLDSQSTVRGATRIEKFRDGSGVAHFTNTGVP